MYAGINYEAPCLCGSGRRFEECCAAHIQQSAQVTEIPVSELGEPGVWYDLRVVPGGVDPEGDITSRLFHVQLFCGGTGASMMSLSQPAPSLIALPNAISVRAQHAVEHQRVIEFLVSLDARKYIDIVVAYNLQATSPEEARDIAYNSFSPLLSYFTFVADVPSSIGSVVTTDVNSGTITTHYQAPYVAKQLNIESNWAWALPRGLMVAFSAYREAINSPNPFHSFLTLWKIAEFVFHQFRRELDAKAKKVGIAPQRPTEQFSDGKYATQSYSSVVFQHLKAPYRNAVAHLTHRMAHTIDTYNDQQAVLQEIPYLKKIIRDILENDVSVWGAIRRTNSLKPTEDPVFAYVVNQLSTNDATRQ